MAGAQGERCFEFAFDTHPSSQNIIACTSDPDVIALVESQLALPENERNMFIIGPIDYGTRNNNPMYDWHFVPDIWFLTAFAVEVCDGSPQFVQNNIQYFVETVGSYCPWSSYVLREVSPGPPSQSISETDWIALLPNPLSGPFLYVVWRNATVVPNSIKIYNTMGNEVISYPVTYHSTYYRIPAGSLNAGMYTVRIITDNKVYTGQLVVN